MYTVSDKQKYWRSRKLYRVLKDDRVSCFYYYNSIFNIIYWKLAPYLYVTWHRYMFKDLFRFQIKPDDIKAKLDDRKARKNEEYLQYLADNNLQNTYAPTKGKIFLLKCVVVVSMMNLFFLKIRICVEKFSHFQHFRGTFLYNFFWF